jgi:Nucleotidyl transferase of unknown function (DUF2204)
MTALPHAFLSQSTIAFYRRALQVMKDAGVPALVGGAYAFARYTGIERHTKDFDVFIRPDNFDRCAWAFRKAGYEAELTFPHWLGKAFHGDDFVDLIFSAGNGVARVDDTWFTHAVREKVFGVDVELIPPEEMIWSKGLIMERERYDGADVAHVIRAVGKKLDWRRLIDRYAEHWRALFAHVILFGFIYPSERSNVPTWVIDELSERLRRETAEPDAAEKICFGTIISRQQYLKDIEEWGYRDARLQPLGNMTAEEIAHWTAGIAQDGSPK